MNEPWWESFYDNTFADVVMAAGEDAAAQTAASFLMEKLDLHPGNTVFDQCCGLGRVSIPLARRHLHLIGVDIIESYIKRAAAAAHSQGLECEFFVGDAFEFVPNCICDGAFNWWSSFGYVEENARNAQMLRCAFTALKPGGRFAMDYYSVPRLLRDFQDRIQVRYPTEHGESLVTRQAQVDFKTGMIQQQWSYLTPGGAEQKKRSATKMYMPHELSSLLLECGFHDVELYGSANGEAFTMDSPRCMLVARKPA